MYLENGLLIVNIEFVNWENLNVFIILDFNWFLEMFYSLYIFLKVD